MRRRDARTIAVLLSLASESWHPEKVVLDPEDAADRDDERRAPTILVVDDDPDVVGILDESLRELGYSVLGARDGIDALEQLERSGCSAVDVLITDLNMPRASGFDLMRHIRAQERPVAIIVISSFADESLRREAKDLGAKAVFHKPFRLGDLLRTVRRLAPPHEPWLAY